jgi:hypothetical protein
MDKNKMKKLTTHDLAFGMGRKATDEELEELLSRPNGKGKDIEQVRKEIKEGLKEKRDKRKAS